MCAYKHVWCFFNKRGSSVHANICLRSLFDASVGLHHQLIHTLYPYLCGLSMQRFSRLTKKQRVIIFVSCLFVSSVGSHVMSLPRVVFAGSKGVRAEDKNDPLQDALVQLITFILHPDNQHFAAMQKYFTLSRLCTIGSILLASPLDSVRKSLLEPFFEKEEKPDDFDFMKKEWGSLTFDEKTTIENQPYKFIRLRYRINRTASVLYPFIRLVFIHVIPSTIVLRWGFDEVATDVWQLSVKAFFMTLYAIYLVAVVLMFAAGDKVEFVRMFLVSFPPSGDIDKLWDGRDNLMGPLPWLGGLLVWCTFGLEMVCGLACEALLFNLGVQRASDISARALRKFVFTKWSITLVCLFFCFTETNPEFWNLAGAFLGSMSFFGYCFFTIILWQVKPWMEKKQRIIVNCQSQGILFDEQFSISMGLEFSTKQYRTHGAIWLHILSWGRPKTLWQWEINLTFFWRDLYEPFFSTLRVFVQDPK